MVTLDVFFVSVIKKTDIFISLDKGENMKKTIALIVSLIMVLSMSASLTAFAGESKEIVVFAAASLTETLTQIAEIYKEENPDVTITFNFDSSGTLKTQIEEGADCDLFVSAAPKQMNALEEMDLIDKETRKNLLENKVVLAVSEENPADLKSFDDMAERLSKGEILLGMGNSDVPVGQYTLKILDFYKIDPAELEKNGTVTYGTNVKEVTTQVSELSVDCGIIYETDAFSAGLKAVDSATEEMCGKVIYPAALIKGGADEAKDFLGFLGSDKACEIFESVGFTPIKSDN